MITCWQWTKYTLLGNMPAKGRRDVKLLYYLLITNTSKLVDVFFGIVILLHCYLCLGILNHI